MTNKEQQLEAAVDSIKNYEVAKAPPVFELFAALVAISISILLMLLPGVFTQNDTLFYQLMRSVFPQIIWAFVFCGGGVMGALGMLLDSLVIRIVALLLLGTTYGVVAAFYIITFPNLAGILMFWIAIFTIASVPMVKYTGIRK